MKLAFLILALAVSASSFGQFVEGGGAHGSKATAQAFTFINGSTLDGSISVGSENDFYKIGLGAQTPGIYRNQLLTSRRNGATATALSTLRGQTVTGGVINTASDTATQFSSAVGTNSDSLNQFFSFGLATDVFQRVTGATARDYKVSFSQTLVTPIVIGSTFAPGAFSIVTNGVDTDGVTTDQVDTEVVLYNSSFGVVAQNDDTSGTSIFSTINANLTAGTYFLAVSDIDISTHVGPAPSDGFQGGDVMDFAGTVLNSSTALTGFNQSTIDTSFLFTSPTGSQQLNAIKAERYGVNWYKFEVADPVPEPASMIVLGLGAFGLLRRKKK